MPKTSVPVAIAWTLIAAWALVTLTSLLWPHVLSANLARYINVAILSAFTLVHGARRYGMPAIVFYFVVAVLVTNVFENMSITTGFPFGHYHHTATMGPKVWHVPVIVGPIFAVAGYLAWVIAGILLGEVFAQPRAGVAVARPLLAAFLTTSWDLCVDPIGGTLNRDWVWADGGAWFGVPWLNFFGWMLTTWFFFQIFAGFIVRTRAARSLPENDPAWLQAVVYWALIALQFPLIAAVVPDFEVTDPAGVTWHSAHILTSMAVTSVFTLLFSALLAFVLLRQAQPPR